MMSLFFIGGGMDVVKCDKCPFSVEVSCDEFRRNPIIKVAIDNKCVELCPGCYRQYKEIVNHYDNLRDAELKEWRERIAT